jgi:tRNA (cmo5U34)-methyltransferase
MTARHDTVWQDPALAKHFVHGVRGSIPLAQTQLDVILRIVKAWMPDGISSFLDLGCGDGVLGRALLSAYPDAVGVFSDFSAPMLDAARDALADEPNAANQILLQNDYADPTWVDDMQPYAPFDVIVSGFSIHHQPDERKRVVYQGLYDLLRPGGVFLNLEHVSTPEIEVEHLFDDLMIDAQYGYVQSLGDPRDRTEIANTYYYRPDKIANILAPVEVQCEWLREIGFTRVDCYLKIFELALFGGYKPVL